MIVTGPRPSSTITSRRSCPVAVATTFTRYRPPPKDTTAPSMRALGWPSARRAASMSRSGVVTRAPDASRTSTVAASRLPTSTGDAPVLSVRRDRVASGMPAIAARVASNAACI